MAVAVLPIFIPGQGFRVFPKALQSVHRPDLLMKDMDYEPAIVQNVPQIFFAAFPVQGRNAKLLQGVLNIIMKGVNMGLGIRG